MEGIRIKATPEEIVRVATDVTGLAGEFSEYTTLLSQGADITSAWGGDGSIEFTAKIQECVLELKKMAGILEETGTTLKTQANNYEAAQEANRANAQRLL
ncbi:MAG: WXG100 family type VII secretion target [Peptococcaceae bacterium]|nr:WXG100 family type VII secretion target [Peptococcaceae bacterium]